MDSETTEMHLNFADWMRTADFGNDREALKNRWASIHRILYIDGISQEKEDQLIRYVFLGEAPTGELEWFQSEFKKDDEIFSMDEDANHNELFALAAVFIGLSMDKNSLPGAITGTRILTSICGGHRSPKGSTPLCDLASQEIKNYSIDARKRSFNKVRNILQWPENEINVAITAIQPNAPATMQAAVTAISAPIKGVLDELKKIDDSFDVLEKNISVQDEEIDLLWWVINGYSEKLDIAFDSLKDGLRTLICGIEVADRIVLDVEPPSLKALLSRAGLDAVEKKELSEILKEVSDSVKSLVTDLSACPVMTPVQFAIECLDDIGKDSWHEKWERETGLKSNIKLSSLEWAVQICRERLVLSLESEE